MLATAPALYMIWLTNIAVLIVVRRWRHLFVWIGVFVVVVPWASGWPTVCRPRPEVEILGDWSGFSMPSSR